MLVPDLSGMVPWLVAFFAVAVLAGLLATAVAVDAVRTHRRARLATHQGVRAYYRGLALAH